MEVMNKVLSLGIWGIILVVVLEISALITGSLLIKEEVMTRNDKITNSSNLIYFDEYQKLKGDK